MSIPMLSHICTAAKFLVNSNIIAEIFQLVMLVLIQSHLHGVDDDDDDDDAWCATVLVTITTIA